MRPERLRGRWSLLDTSHVVRDEIRRLAGGAACIQARPTRSTRTDRRPSLRLARSKSGFAADPQRQKMLTASGTCVPNCRQLQSPRCTHCGSALPAARRPGAPDRSERCPRRASTRAARLAQRSDAYPRSSRGPTTRRRASLDRHRAQRPTTRVRRVPTTSARARLDGERALSALPNELDALPLPRPALDLAAAFFATACARGRDADSSATSSATRFVALPAQQRTPKPARPARRARTAARRRSNGELAMLLASRTRVLNCRHVRSPSRTHRGAALPAARPPDAPDRSVPAAETD